MSWRATATVPDRLFAVLPYLLPLFYSAPFGSLLFDRFPVLQIIFIPVIPVALLYSIPFAGIAIFMVLLLLVVRNDSISYFIRFNTMQALLLGIVLFLCQLLTMVLGNIEALGFIFKVLSNFIFIAVVGVVLYSVVQSLRGIYAEIPAISDAAKSQVG
jgi:Chloroplast import apparatus Tic20-like